MTTFWKHLHRLAQGQLFNGGYLNAEPEAAPPAAAKPEAERQRTITNEAAARRPRHAPIAAYR